MAALSTKERQQYHTTGFLALGSYFAPSAVEEMARAAQDLAAQVGPIEPGNPRIQVDRVGGEYVIRQAWPVIDLSPTFARLAADERIVGLFRSLFDDEPVLFEDKVNYKHPHGGSEFLLHQDLTYWEGCSPRLVSALIYIDEATEENGCLEVVPGWHRRGVLEKRIAPAGLGSEHEIPPETIDPALAVKVPGPAGTLVLFSCTTPHASRANRTSRPRRAIIFTYNPAADGSRYEAMTGPNRDRSIAWLAARKPGSAPAPDQ
jgi:hypothetical protein